MLLLGSDTSGHHGAPFTLTLTGPVGGTYVSGDNGEHITIDAKAKFQQAQKVTVLLNKPVGYVSGQAEDGYEPAVVLVTPQNQWRDDHSGTRFLREHLRGLAPAGRLDIDSVGLLVLTQDGRIARQLIGEDSEIEKEYLVRVERIGGGALPADDLALLNHGLSLDGEALQPALVEWINADQLRFGDRPEARAHRRRDARRSARGAVALSASRRAVRVTRRYAARRRSFSIRIASSRPW